MQTHRTTFPNRTAAVAAVVALGITASCGSDDNDDPNTGQPVETTVEASTEEASVNATEQASGPGGEAKAALEEAVLMLEGVSFLEPDLFVLGDPFEEYDASVEMYTLTLRSLEAIRSEFPDAAEMQPEGSDTYVAVLEHLDEWTASATNSLAELEERRSELEPALGTGDPGSPAEEYAELVGLNPDAFEEFGQRCAEFAVSVGLAINCFGTPAPGADGSIEFTAGSVTLLVDPGPIDEYFVQPDWFGAELSSSASMSISAPFPVRGPATAIESEPEPGAPLEQTVPWPDDIDEYLAAGPFEAIDDVTVSTPSGDFRRLTLAQDAAQALTFMNDPGGPLIVWEAQPLTLWIGEIAGQIIIGTLRNAADEQSFETSTPQLEDALGTLRAVGS